MVVIIIAVLITLGVVNIGRRKADDARGGGRNNFSREISIGGGANIS